MGKISNAYYSLRGTYHRWRGRTPKPQTVDLGRRDAARRILGTVGVVVGAATGATSLGAVLGACKEKAPSSKVKTIKVSTNNIFDNNLWEKVWKDYGVRMSVPPGQSIWGEKTKIKVRVAKNVANVEFVSTKARWFGSSRYGSYRQDNMGQGVKELHFAIPKSDGPVLCIVATVVDLKDGRTKFRGGEIARFKFRITYKNGKTKDLEIDYVPFLDDPREITKEVEKALKKINTSDN